MIRFLLWRLLGLIALLAGLALAAWCLSGGLGRSLRGASTPATPAHLGHALSGAVAHAWQRAPAAALRLEQAAGVSLALAGSVLVARSVARSRRRYVRLKVEPYRTDTAAAESVVKLFEALHKRVLHRWWRRLVLGQPAVALEIHHRIERAAAEASANHVSMALCCQAGRERSLEAALRTAYPNCRLTEWSEPMRSTSTLLRLKKDAEFIRRAKVLDHFEHEREPPVNRLLTVMAATQRDVTVQLAVAPAPVLFERLARRLFRAREDRLAKRRRAGLVTRDRSMVDEVELRGGLDLQHQALFFVDIRVVSSERRACELVASELRAESAENRLVERATTVRHGMLSLYRRRIQRGEGNPLAPMHRGVFASPELAAIWHLPSIDYATVPFARGALALAPAPPAVLRTPDGEGTLHDGVSPVSIHENLRKQNTAVPGAVEQGKSSYLIATVAEDLRRDRCAVIVFDPKGDAADAAVSLVPESRVCTLLDFAHPTCGFNPLAVDAPADVIADYVVAALRNLFDDADIRASSDRYLRNAIIAVLAFDRSASLWDAARLLSVGEEGYSYRRVVGSRVRTLPAYKEISAFFTSELTAQLADARSMTTAKLDAPVNKLARLLNSASIKRVLLNGSLTLNFDDVIARREVLVVKGALGSMGGGNTSVLMQLLVGMLDAALARQQDMVGEQQRVAVALKVDEAPLVLNRGFAETIALKRSAGLETVACWQSDAQWTDREVRDQLDALFAHRVYFATASTREARAAVGLTMPEFSDTVRPGIAHLSKLARPDARLHLPRHHAIASWTTPEGRQAPFLASTIPLRVEPQRIALHVQRQHARGGRHLADLRQPHWQDQRSDAVNDRPTPVGDDGRGQNDASTARAHDAPREGPRPAPGHADGPTAVPAAIGATGGPMQSEAQGAGAEPSRALPSTPCESYRELVELDRAHSVRWAKSPDSIASLEPDSLDLAVLGLVVEFRHVLSSQLHRRLNARRSVTTTQRRLKRLSDAGLVERFQFHRRDGGGVPMCYVMTARGIELLRAVGRMPWAADAPDCAMPSSSSARRGGGDHLRQARHDVHVAGWVLAFLRRAPSRRFELRGRDRATISPPTRPTSVGRVAFGPADLRLPGGRIPHDFLRRGADGTDVEVERFETIRPDAIVELATTEAAGERPAVGDSEAGDEALAGGGAVDLVVELDDRLTTARGIAKLERYDHFLAGWSAHSPRYSPRREAVPLVVFVCRDRDRARSCARHADALLRACRAYAGEYPFDWEYPGRERILFVAERDMHEGLHRAYGVPPLPPSVRVTEAHGDPRARETSPRRCEL